MNGSKDRHQSKKQASNIKEQASTIPPTLSSRIRNSEFFLLFSKDHRRIFLLALVLAIFGMSTYWFTYSWLPDYLYSERDFDLAKSAEFVIVSQIDTFFGYISFGFVADRIGRRPTYTIYKFIMAVGLAMITMFWSRIELHNTLILTFMFILGFGTGFFGGYGALFTELFPPK